MTHSRRRVRYIAKPTSVASVLAILLLYAAAPAIAHPSGVVADNPSHSWCYGSSTDGHGNVKDAAAYAMNNLDTQTDMSEDGPHPCSSTIDVQFAVSDLSGSRGQWSCLQTSGTNPVICHKARVTFDPDQIQSESGGFDLNLKKTGCHEVGHSAGLEHHAPPYGDCMVSGPVDSGHQQYNYDHYIWINNNY